MAGNGDEAKTGVTSGATWLARVIGRLEDLVEETIETLGQIEVKPNDVPGAERKARAIANLARAAGAVDALRARKVRPAVRDINEDGMSEDDRGDDIDPAELDRIRADLESRLDSLRATIEAKRLDGWTVVRGVDPGVGDDTGAAWSSDHSPV